jgi:MFS family permease
MSAGRHHGTASPVGLSRRLRPLQVGAVLQGLMLWVPVEKLFQTQIGFDAAAIAVMAAAYAAVVPLLEVPSGILADRWSRTGILIISSVAAAASALVGGLSHNVATYILAAMILGVYFAMNSGTVDSIVYDTVIEETGSPDLYERWIGRIRIVESAAFTTSALAGGLLAGWTSPRLTYFLTVPFVLASIVAFSRFREPRLHRAAEPLALRRHAATTVRAMTGIQSVRRVLLLAALTALLSQAIFEFGPLWLVALHAPTAAFGPYWALLVATLGIGGYLAARLHLGRRSTALTVAAIVAAVPILLATSLPFSLGFGALARTHGVYPAGWILVGTCAALAALLVLSTRTAQIEALDDDPHPQTTPPPADLACRQRSTESRAGSNLQISERGCSTAEEGVDLLRAVAGLATRRPAERDPRDIRRGQVARTAQSGLDDAEEPVYLHLGVARPAQPGPGEDDVAYIVGTQAHDPSITRTTRQ